VVELSRRDLAVLYEIVDLYIRAGAPVASRDVARSSRLGLSSATIRNIMARLEEAGLVTRPHLSAGCCPTDISLRAWVDRLEPPRRVPARAQHEVLHRVATLGREPEEDISWVARLVADVTCEAGVAIRPIGEEPLLEAVSLVRLSTSRVLAVLVTAEGAVGKRVIALDDSFDREELERLSAELSRRLRGRSLSALRELVQGQGEGDADRLADDGGPSPRVVAVARTLFADDESDAEVRVAGADALALSSEFAEVDRLRSLVNVLEDRARIAREWRRVLRGRRTRVIIGDESEVTASGDLGMVASLFFRQGHRVGALGVVGPRRMDYGRIVPLVEFIADMVTRMLEEPGVKHA
jgi:heat-inducible transcriptional repressor